MKKGKIPASVDEYMSQLPEREREILSELRKQIRKAAPDALETISFRMPAYKLNGTLVLFAAFSTHMGFYVVNPGILKDFEKELAGYTLLKNGIQFTAKNPLPGKLVTNIVKQRVKENKAN